MIKTNKTTYIDMNLEVEHFKYYYLNTDITILQNFAKPTSTYLS